MQVQGQTWSDILGYVWIRENNEEAMKSYPAIVVEANKMLERDGESYRFGCDGIAVCKECGATWFPNDRYYPACEHNKEFSQ